MNNVFRIGKVYISITNPKDAEEQITQAALSGINNYICVSNMRTVVLAQKDQAYLKVMNEAWMCAPDGMPLTWMAHLWGHKNVERTAGPDLLMSMLSKTTSGVKHFLLGDTEDTLRLIEEKYNSGNIVGSYSPPFCDLGEYDYKHIASLINASGANVVWVSLRAPKQDYFSTMLLPYLDRKVCIGVGAAFRFAIGQYRHPNKIVQRLGLTGFFLRKNKMRLLVDTVIRSIYLISFSIDILFSRLIGKY